MFVLSDGVPGVLSGWENPAGGFDWGVGAHMRRRTHLAYELLMDAIDDRDFVLDTHREFAIDVVDRLPTGGWKRSLTEIVDWAMSKGFHTSQTGS